MIRIFVLTSLIAIFSGCGDFSPLHLTRPLPSDSSKNVASDLDFATIKEEVLDTCIACHSDRHKAYENYAVVKASTGTMLERMTTSNPKRLMPPDNPLSPEQIALFRKWVEAGAPEFTTAKETLPAPPEPRDPPAPEPPPSKSIDFKKLTERVLKPYRCISCHTHYRDYATVYKNRGTIVSLVSSDQMPFPKKKNGTAPPVSDADKMILLDWVAQGAPEFADRPRPVTQQKPLEPTWVSLRNHVFGPKCILCHNSYGNRGDGIAFGTYTQLRNWFTKKPGLFKFEKEAEEAPGLFVESILRDPDDPLGGLFSPMPLNSESDDLLTTIPRVTPEELKVIEAWIDAKLPYDEHDN